jgi:hypothetical protein
MWRVAAHRGPVPRSIRVAAMMPRMIRRFSGATVALLATALLAGGCGDDESKKGEESEGARTACKAPATTDETGLPAAFPIPGELTITEVRKDGPTNVIDGYWSSDLDEAYPEFKEQVEQAGYEVLFTEKEEHDAEISYADKANGRSGQVALRDDCSEESTIRVHITNRPA